MWIELRGRISEAGILEVELPEGIPSGAVTVRIETETEAWTDEEIEAIKAVAPKTFEELAVWLETNPPVGEWGGLREDEDAAEYIHRQRHTPSGVTENNESA